MISYIVGKVISTNKKTITFENNWVGYNILVPDPKVFEVNKVRKIFLYKQTTNNLKGSNIEEYYGFDNYEQKDLFIKLIEVSGIGPRTAIGILKNDIKILKNAIASKNLQTLESLENISNKIAKAILNGISIEISEDNNANYAKQVAELIKALKSLGYKQKEIEYAIKKLEINDQSDLSDLIALSVKNIAEGSSNDFLAS